jgi:hypothetical protein
MERRRRWASGESARVGARCGVSWIVVTSPARKKPAGRGTASRGRGAGTPQVDPRARPA